MAFRIGDNAVDVTYSTKPGIQGVAFGGINNTIIKSGINTNQVGGVGVGVGGSIMGVGGGVGDNAADVTYSTRPGAQGVAFGGINNTLMRPGIISSGVVGNNTVNVYSPKPVTQGLALGGINNIQGLSSNGVRTQNVNIINSQPVI